MAGGSITGDSCIQNQKPKKKETIQNNLPFSKNPIRLSHFIVPPSLSSFSLYNFSFFTSFLPVIRPNPLLYSAISSTPFLILQSITWVLFINHRDFTFPVALFVDQKFNQE